MDQVAHAWLAAIVENSDDAIIGVDPDLVIVSWNAGAERLFGYSAAEMLGRPGQGLVPNDSSHAGQRDAIEQTLRQGQRIGNFETQRVRRDGTTVDVSLTVSPVYGSAGELAGFSAIVRDVSEAKRRERALAESENRFRALVEASPDMVAVTGPDGLLASLNPAFEVITGFRRDDWLGKSPAPLLHPDDLASSANAINAAITGETVRPREVRVRTQRGAYVVLESHTRSLIRDGNVVGVLTVSRDITERKRDETRIAALLDSAPDALVVVDGTGAIELVNRQAEHIFGYERGEMVGRHVESLVPARVHARHPDLRLSYISSPEPRQMGLGRNLTARRKDGTEFPVDVSLSPVETDAGMLVTAAVRDISERRRVRDERDRAVAASAAILGRLSAREFEVLELLCDGIAAARIAERLHLSVRTVESHVASAYRKLGVNSRDDAVQTIRRLTSAQGGDTPA